MYTGQLATNKINTHKIKLWDSMALFTLNINIYVPIISDGTNPTDTETNSSTWKVLADTTLSCSHSGNSAFHESTIKRKPFRFWTTV